MSRVAWQREIEIGVQAALAAGDLLTRMQTSDLSVVSSEGKDIKLQADREAENVILHILRQSSDYPILSEESGEQGGIEFDKPFWIVDPLDGTVNYKHGLPPSCVSIALWQGYLPLLGVVNDFCANRLYKGSPSQGCWLNDKPIRVSAVTDPSSAILATGFPVNRSYHSEDLGRFISQIQSFKKIRMIGSAAASLAYVASGVMEAYAEDDIMLWDVAAGIALVQAAGGWTLAKPSESRSWAMNVRCGTSKTLFEKGEEDHDSI